MDLRRTHIVAKGAATAESGRGLKRADRVRKGFEYRIYAAVGLRETLGRQHGCSLTSFWSAAASELVLSRTVVVASSDDSLTEQYTPLLLLSGRTTRLYEYHSVVWSLYKGPPMFISTRRFGNRPSSV
ncbi:uncharacterized protein LOC112598657 [Melanaphis sacchari]|uniref:uncharacterized protein LOC112598657 n=1 Tax=Melanaphis sacchari TaxID=742174 RepID=UPI000DC13D76|nr:uncharacterized protein LOC112598657 [Melanaphis sacchari]